MSENEIEVFYPTSQVEWREWLHEHHHSRQSVWLVFYKKSSAKPSISWSEAVDIALCYGWIDSKKISIDHEKSHQFFSKRKAKGTWSKINKEKIIKLTEAGLMHQSGLDVIEAAKQNGSWTILDLVEALVIPADLEKELNRHTGAMDFFLSLSKSVRKILLYGLMIAKRPETRQKRLNEIVEMAVNKSKPKLF